MKYHEDTDLPSLPLLHIIARNSSSCYDNEVPMQYRKNKTGEDISLLGYGCMRFTRKGAAADIDKAEKEVRLALEGGVNYFDTAYVYPGNEAALGEILRRIGCRKDINIATKLPHYLIKSMDGIEKAFEEQLRRLQTDYIDYYLMHMLTDTETWENLKKLGYGCTLVNVRFVKPLDRELLERLTASHELLVTMEENVLSGGFGEHAVRYLETEKGPEHVPKFLNIAIEDVYVEHGNVELLRQELGLDAASVTDRITEALERL